MCTHIWWQQIEKYVGQPLASESLCALVSDSPGWIRFAAMSSHVHGWCFSRHLLPLFAMLVFAVCVALTLSSRREGPCVSAHRSVPSAPLTESAQWPDGWMKGEPCLLLHLFSVHVAWQSSLTPRHWAGGGGGGEGVTSFTANRRKFPGLVWKVQISNIAPMSTVFLMRWLSFSMLPVAYVTEGGHLSAHFLSHGWTMAGLMGLWHRGCGLESHRWFRFSYDSVTSRYFPAWKISLWKELCVLKAVVWNLHVQKPLCWVKTDQFLLQVEEGGQEDQSPDRSELEQ